MELRVLQYFLTVVQEENISRAAEVLHVTQPTLSRQMAQLEEELGVQLFVRGRHLTLTDAGVMLRRRAEEVTALMEKMQQELEGHADVGGVISIGSGGLMALQALSPAMAAFREQHPKVQYQLYTNHVEHVKERLEQGLLDFGLLLEPVDVSKFDYLRMGARETWGAPDAVRPPAGTQTPHCAGGSGPAPPHHLRPPLHPKRIGDLAWHGVFPAESLCHL